MTEEPDLDLMETPMAAPSSPIGATISAAQPASSDGFNMTLRFRMDDLADASLRERRVNHAGGGPPWGRILHTFPQVWNERSI